MSEDAWNYISIRKSFKSTIHSFDFGEEICCTSKVELILVTSLYYDITVLMRFYVLVRSVSKFVIIVVQFTDRVYI